MSTSSGPQEPHDQNRSGQDMYAPEENIPRQDQQGQYDNQGQYGYQGQQQQYAPPPPGAGQYGYSVAPGQLTYLQGAPVGFADAVRGAFQNIFTFRGRASRSAFWWFALLGAIVYLIGSLVSDSSTVAGVIVDIILVLPTWIASITLSVRRLHDSGRTGWWWWIGLVPLVGWIVLLVFYLTPGTPGPNRYNTAI